MAGLGLLVMLLWGLLGCATLFGPSVTARDMRFFEHGARESGPRTYQTQFDASKARFIQVELKLEYPPPGRSDEIPMACLYKNPAGKPLEERPWTLRVEPTSGSAYTGTTLGSRTPGSWTPGTYHVECRAKGWRIAESAFEVVSPMASRPAPPRESSSPGKPKGAPSAPSSTPPVAPPKPVAASFPSQPRFALVIGIAKYPDSPLRNSLNDAREIASLLGQLDFTVTLVLDANQRVMREAVRDFTEKVSPGSMGLFYFSGHAAQVEGENYLIPSGGVFRLPSDLTDGAVRAHWVLERMDDAGMDMKVLILDACRDNPFGRQGTRTLRGGLAVMTAPKGSLVAYSTSPGKTALDGEGAHSPYTRQLLQHLPVPAQVMESMFKAVRRGVQQATNDQQTPWENSSVTGDFYFAGR